jgi:hypothetical protein
MPDNQWLISNAIAVQQLRSTLRRHDIGDLGDGGNVSRYIVRSARANSRPSCRRPLEKHSSARPGSWTAAGDRRKCRESRMSTACVQVFTAAVLEILKSGAALVLKKSSPAFDAAFVNLGLMYQAQEEFQPIKRYGPRRTAGVWTLGP